MSTKFTLVLALLALLLFGGAYFFFQSHPTTRDGATQEGQFVEIDRSDIDKITITNPDGEIEIQQTNGGWTIKKPVLAKASISTITQLLTSLEFLKSEVAISSTGEEREKQFEIFGLKSPTSKIKISGKKGETELLFGKPTAVEGRTYAAITGKPEAYVIPNDLPDQLKQKAEDFRDRRLTGLSAQNVNKVLLKSLAGEIELLREGDNWKIEKPLKARANDAKINDMIATLVNAQITKFISDQPGDLVKYGLADPKGRITLESGDDVEPVTISFGVSPEIDPGAVCVKVSGSDATYAISAKAEEGLTFLPNNLRDTNFARINLDTVDRIRIQSKDTNYLLIRDQENWKVKGEKEFVAGKMQVDQMVAAINNAQIANFVADTPSDAPKYGLDQPVLKLIFSAYSSENTAEAPAGEQALATVSFGRLEGDGIYARVEEDPFIVSLDPSIVEQIPADPLEWQDRLVLSLKPEEVSAIFVSRQGKEPVEIARDSEGKWEIKAGNAAALNANAIDSVLNSVKRLTAVRWVGASVQQYGLESPEITIRFTTKSGETSTLKIGAQSPNGMRYAALEGKEGVFLISRPQYETLTLPVTTPKPEINAPPAQ